MRGSVVGGRVVLFVVVSPLVRCAGGGWEVVGLSEEVVSRFMVSSFMPISASMSWSSGTAAAAASSLLVWSSEGSAGGCCVLGSVADSGCVSGNVPEEEEEGCGCDCVSCEAMLTVLHSPIHLRRLTRAKLPHLP